MIRLSRASSIFAVAVCALFFNGGALAQDSTAGKEIERLKEKIAEQDARIKQLEQSLESLSKRFDGETTRQPSQPASNQPSLATPAPSPAAVGVEAKQSDGVKFGGDIYLYQYVPAGISGARPKFELYIASLQLDARHGRWGFYGDYRLRTTKLRSFFPGNTWLQQGYGFYETKAGQIRAGSFYRRVGLVWDDSFFGNIQYFDGLKLSPEFGIGFEGRGEPRGRLGAEYSFQYFTTDARVNGSLPGRDFISEPNARIKNDVTARFAPLWKLGPNVSLSTGISVARGTIERDGGPHNTRSQIAGDFTLKVGGLTIYGEVLRQGVGGAVVHAPQPATYSLAGVRWTRGRYEPRVNFSQANYHALRPRREYIIQPGITVKLPEGFSFIYEYDLWRGINAEQKTTIDRSLNFVLHYHF